MDPITQTVVWGVLWFFLFIGFIPAGWISGAIVGSLLVKSSRDEYPKVAGGAIIGAMIGTLLAVFSLIQVILHIINLVRALTG